MHILRVFYHVEVSNKNFIISADNQSEDWKMPAPLSNAKRKRGRPVKEYSQPVTQIFPGKMV